jgi:hypothetical protein
VLPHVPELRVDLPAHAVGKDYLGMRVFARSPSGTGGQVNLFGVLGLVAGIEEGIDLSLLGLTFGVDPNDVALELPLVGPSVSARRSPLQRCTDERRSRDRGTRVGSSR